MSPGVKQFNSLSVKKTVVEPSFSYVKLYFLKKVGIQDNL